MRNLLLILVIASIGFVSFAQPGPASIDPASMIKDSYDRTVTMKNGEMKNTLVVSHWQLHCSGFQPTVSLPAGDFHYEKPEAPGTSFVTMKGSGISSSMMAPVDLPENSVIQYFEACYIDVSNSSPNYSNCGLTFNLMRVADDGCPPDLIVKVVSSGTGQSPACPIKCSLQTLASGDPLALVNNKDYFYYVIVTSQDTQGQNQTCGDWESANLGLRGVEIEYTGK